MKDQFKTPRLQKALEAARQARDRAYAPYSNYPVGAALLLKGQEDPVPGCNVENATFGATICAERNALLSARARFGKFTPEAIVVVTQDDPPSVPCALCLQVIAEFSPLDLPIYLANQAGIQEETQLGALLPRPFVNREFD